MNENCEWIFLSHASEDKEKIVVPFIECLEEGGISNIWYDKASGSTLRPPDEEAVSSTVSNNTRV
jgi:hypothetical protein